ncbi:putative lysosomal cobalamin transporter-like [Tropilaelaps mercedesae]|uniref:Putative lysosomal cobalamin transporter-like n=1 Tax=Tropilaelaps mercedesae TaxID=418985 RepID=A0A1V9XID1_9ACAR|nr:putative lysosomal cobalamin transporter-like [Tropilaelaps mercedesae]
MAHHWALTLAFSGYIPLILIVAFALCFSWFYTRRYARYSRSNWISYMTVVSGLTFSLLTMLLIPLDVFFASYAKLRNGTWAEWAKNSSLLQDVEDTIEDSYFVFYSIVLVYLFLILPFVYFYCEDLSDPILDSPLGSRIRRASLLGLVFPLALAVLLTVGKYIRFPVSHQLESVLFNALLCAVIPMREHGENGTEWEWLINELKENKGQDAFGFAFSVISIVGVCTLVMYLGLGLMAFPLSLIRGLASAAKERAAVHERLENLKARIAVLKARVQMGNASQEDYHVLTELQQQEADNMRQERTLTEFQSTWYYRFRNPIRSVEILLGFGGLALSFLVLISLFLSNMDKVFNSSPNSGYLPEKTSLPNPIDYMLLQCQKVYPLDYILFVTIVCYLFVCCIYSVQRFGVWVCCFRAYSIRQGKTTPRALIMLSSILILCVFGLNILIYSVSPLYTSFGDQQYITNGSHIQSCGYDAPAGECVQTRATALLSIYNYKMAAFGFGYYWLSWLFIMVAVASYFVFQFKVRTSPARMRMEEDDEDLLE